MDASFIDTRIELISSFDVDSKGVKQELRGYSGIAEDISDSTWIKVGKR